MLNTTCQEQILSIKKNISSLGIPFHPFSIFASSLIDSCVEHSLYKCILLWYFINMVRTLSRQWRARLFFTLKDICKDLLISNNVRLYLVIFFFFNWLKAEYRAAYFSMFQNIPACSSLFKPSPANSSLFLAYFRIFWLVPAYSSLIQFIPAYLCLFQPIPAYSSQYQNTPSYSILFQPIPAYYSLLQPSSAYSSLFQIISAIQAIFCLF